VNYKLQGNSTALQRQADCQGNKHLELSDLSGMSNFMSYKVFIKDQWAI
jgi:hypothetical protein